MSVGDSLGGLATRVAGPLAAIWKGGEMKARQNIMALMQERHKCEGELATLKAQITDVLCEREKALAQKNGLPADKKDETNAIDSKLGSLDTQLGRLRSSEEDLLQKSASLSRLIVVMEGKIGAVNGKGAQPGDALRQQSATKKLDKLEFRKRGLEAKIREVRGQARVAAATGETERQLTEARKASAQRRKELNELKEKLISARAAKTQAIEGSKDIPNARRTELAGKLEASTKELAKEGTSAAEHEETKKSLEAELKSVEDTIRIKRRTGSLLGMKKDYNDAIGSLNEKIQKLEDDIIKLKAEESMKGKMLTEFAEKKKVISRIEQMKAAVGKITPAAVEEAKPVPLKKKAFEVTAGTSLLVKGPLSAGTGFCNDLLKRHMEAGETVAFLAFDPGKEGKPLPEKGRTLFKAHTELNELNITFSDMVRGDPDWIYANIFYRVTPLYSIDKIIQLTTILLDKAKSVGSATLFVVDPATLSSKDLAMIENLFDNSIDVTGAMM